MNTIQMTEYENDIIAIILNDDHIYTQACKIRLDRDKDGRKKQKALKRTVETPFFASIIGIVFVAEFVLDKRSW